MLKEEETGAPPERLGEFRLLERLDAGGMGTVYLAEQEPLGRMVALKVIRPELQASHEARVRFAREAELTGGFARMRCPKCKGEHLLAFSCRTRNSCPSCQKRAASRSSRRS